MQYDEPLYSPPWLIFSYTRGIFVTHQIALTGIMWCEAGQERERERGNVFNLALHQQNTVRQVFPPHFVSHLPHPFLGRLVICSIYASREGLHTFRILFCAPLLQRGRLRLL